MLAAAIVHQRRTRRLVCSPQLSSRLGYELMYHAENDGGLKDEQESNGCTKFIVLLFSSRPWSRLRHISGEHFHGSLVNKRYLEQAESVL